VALTATKTPTTGAQECSWREGNPSTSDDTLSVRVTNNGDQAVLVSHVSITWTGSDHLHYIHWRFEGPFWSGNSAGPTVSSATSKTVPVGAYRTVEFEFWGSSFDGSASVSIDAGC